MSKIGNINGKIIGMKVFPNEEGIAIKDGFHLEESSTPDMNITVTPGTIRQQDNYYYTEAGSVTLTAASAGKNKVAIIQKPYNSEGVVTKKDGVEVTPGTIDAIDSSSSVATGVFYLFQNGSVNYEAHAFKVNNSSGIDLDLRTLSFDIIVQVNGSFDIGIDIATGSSGSYPDNATRITKDTIHFSTDSQSSPVTHTITTNNLDYTLANGSYCWIIITPSNSTFLYNAKMTQVATANALPGFYSGVSVTNVWHSINGGAWSGYGVASTGWWIFGKLTTSEVFAEYPSPDANNIIIGYVGDAETPINENTTALVNGTPSTNQAQIIDVDTYRI